MMQAPVGYANKRYIYLRERCPWKKIGNFFRKVDKDYYSMISPKGGLIPLNFRCFFINRGLISAAIKGLNREQGDFMLGYDTFLYQRKHLKFLGERNISCLYWRMKDVIGRYDK